MTSEVLNTCTKLIQQAEKIVVLTGAGISTESGIKDFRSRTGIYKLAPEHILSLDYFYQHPKEFYEFALENLYHPNALPNKGHEILAKWEQAKKVTAVITQNIDGLHQKAGSQNVMEFHGTMKTSTCMNCKKKYTTDEMLIRMNTMEHFYECDNCETEKREEHFIKPDVVLFGDTGEWFTTEGFHTIVHYMNDADFVLVLGTSLLVAPFSMFPQYRKQGVPLCIINKGETPYDFSRDTYVIHESIGQTLLQMDKSL
ncbi:NAD-dependent protein deacylase [Bacillus sp. FJAT-49736]|uniref:NAD-dependent protein deacylase n=1 Tax=Bacillus sp. FJAT-49736 TaxID=2833582 RepID=UPI001BCA1334|nr:NAD-dependent protein deacylase [Bacillus sp. FJAT-49736]MBS4172886.1 NAD-dependent protein deacylase [Bacillus sp. FJAT-49736]